MRLRNVATGQRLRHKLLLAMMRVAMRARVPDVLRVNLYRPELFGRPFTAWVQEAMRGPSDWSPGERELFAAFVSCQNQCPF